MATTSKNQIASKLASRVDITVREAREEIDHLMNIIGEEISAGNKVSLTGWLTFGFGKSAAIKKGTMKRNPFSGEEAPHPGKPAALKVRVTAGKTLKGKVPAATSKIGKQLMSGK